ncbi:unnamed protein product [marine sediment metagenome]|uniref:Uncharacterized protein n=1 Tax=marine sediment metagenome TaxID=412755 RepID=X0VBZ2_9ZZZZ
MNKEILNKILCILGLHRWNAVNSTFPDKSEKQKWGTVHSKAVYYYHTRWRYCPMCEKIESLIKWGFRQKTHNYLVKPVDPTKPILVDPMEKDKDVE